VCNILTLGHLSLQVEYILVGHRGSRMGSAYYDLCCTFTQAPGFDLWAGAFGNWDPLAYFSISFEVVRKSSHLQNFPIYFSIVSRDWNPKNGHHSDWRRAGKRCRPRIEEHGLNAVFYLVSLYVDKFALTLLGPIWSDDCLVWGDISPIGVWTSTR
jgi:hypothetical protein